MRRKRKAAAKKMVTYLTCLVCLVWVGDGVCGGCDYGLGARMTKFKQPSSDDLEQRRARVVARG